MEGIEIFIRKSRVYRHLLLALLWYGIIGYRVYSGSALGSLDAVGLLAGMSFSFWFYVEWKRPYITIDAGVFTRGLFFKQSIELKAIEEWQNRNGILYLAGAKKKVKVVPAMISQSDMEQIYEVLRAGHTKEEAEFIENHGL